ncbi:MAG: ferrous iron transport protein A [Bryobacteraceae bacterium]|nr:ferrous iron transport protein A [Bryobacteraceae bacterium]
MQLSFNKGVGRAALPTPVSGNRRATLADLREGQTAVIDEVDLPYELAHRLMELGFLPGVTVEAARSAPGGGPRVFRIDGTEIALRIETSSHVTIKVL